MITLTDDKRTESFQSLTQGDRFSLIDSQATLHSRPIPDESCPEEREIAGF
jgi:hypothetical protein